MNAEDQFRKSEEIHRQTYALATDFLRIELGLSLTFAEVALGAGRDWEKRLRNQAAAMKGCQTILHFLKKYPAAIDQSEQFKAGLRRLKDALETLGKREPHDFNSE